MGDNYVTTLALATLIFLLNVEKCSNVFKTCTSHFYDSAASKSARQIDQIFSYSI